MKGIGGLIGGSLKGPCAKMFLPKSAKIKYHIDKELLFQDNENQIFPETHMHFGITCKRLIPQHLFFFTLK